MCCPNNTSRSLLQKASIAEVFNHRGLNEFKRIKDTLCFIPWPGNLLLVWKEWAWQCDPTERCTVIQFSMVHFLHVSCVPTENFNLFVCVSFSCSWPELQQAGSVSLFSGPADGLLSHSLLLDEERGRLLLGARDHIYLLDPNNLSKAPRKVKIQMI